MAYFFALGIAIPDNTKIPMNNSDDFGMFPIQAVRKEVRLLNALKENGIRVPEDVSVVGFDDYILADLAVPSLTTYAIDVDHMAKVSAQQLIRRIQKPEAEVRRIVVSGKLVIRESVQKHSGNTA